MARAPSTAVKLKSVSKPPPGRDPLPKGLHYGEKQGKDLPIDADIDNTLKGAGKDIEAGDSKGGKGPKGGGKGAPGPAGSKKKLKLTGLNSYARQVH